MFKVIASQYLIFIALFSIYQGYVLLGSDLPLLQSSAIIRGLDANASDSSNHYAHLQRGLKLASHSMQVSPDNPRSYLYVGLFLAQISEWQTSKSVKALFLKDAEKNIAVAAHAMPLSYHVQQDLKLIQKKSHL